MTFLAILILVLIAALVISIFFGAISLLIRFALPILVIALIIWLYNRHKGNSVGGSYTGSNTESNYEETFTNGERKEARNVQTKDVDPTNNSDNSEE